MIQINLRDFYPECYRSDYFVEVPEEVAELLLLLKRHEQSQRRRIYKRKAQYSLDAYPLDERELLIKSPSAEETYVRFSEREKLIAAIMTLTEKQRIRLYAHYYLGKSYTEIAAEEGVDVSAVRMSVQRALKSLQKKFEIF